VRLVAAACAVGIVLLGCGARTPLGPEDGEDGGSGGASSSVGAFVGTSSGAGTGTGGVGACEEVPPSGAAPLLDYPFDGDAFNRGSLVGYDGVAAAVSWVEGVRGRAVAMGGYGSVVEMPLTSAELNELTAFTIALWFREDRVSNDGGQLIDMRGFLRGFHSYHGVSGDALFTCWGAGHPDNGPGGCGSFDYPVGVWHALIFRHAGRGLAPGEGAPLELIVDGVPVLTLDNPELEPILGHDAVDLSVGRDSIFEIDDLRVYDRVFSPAEQCSELAGGRWCNGTCVTSPPG
jgi:hypothetical protein